MKNTLLSLVLLSSMPLLSKNAAANPTATVGNSASAAADTKSRVAQVSASNAIALVEPERPAAPAEADAKGLGEIRAYLMKMAGDMEANCWRVHNELRDKAAAVPLAGPSWEQMNGALRGYFGNPPAANIPVPVTNIILDYAQSNVKHPPTIVSEIEKKTVLDPILERPELLRDLQYTDLSSAFDSFIESNRDRRGSYCEYEQKWEAAGFRGEMNATTQWNWGMACPGCNQEGTLFQTTDVGHYRIFSLWPWQDPKNYHRDGCKVAQGIQNGPIPIPIQRTQPEEFANYVMRLIDIYVHQAVTAQDIQYPDRTQRLKPGVTFAQAMCDLSEQLFIETEVLKFTANPKAFVAEQNARFAKLGLPVRYQCTDAHLQENQALLLGVQAWLRAHRP